MSQQKRNRTNMLSPTKRSLLSLLIKKEGISERHGETIRLRNETGARPLSFAQQRLWFLSQLEPGNSFYNMPAAVKLYGKLDVPVLERSFTELVRRHEVLRTSFVRAPGGDALQVVSAQFQLPLPVEDISSLTQGQREQQVRQLAAQEAGTPFDLSRGPLLRVRILRLGEQEHVLLMTMHHIISDGWSMGVMVREVAALYEAYSRGEESPLEELAIQYADYAVWQREWLQGEVLEEQIKYWREQLAGAPAVLELPTDYPRPPVQTYRGTRRKLRLGHGLSAPLRHLSQSEGVTLFMLLLGAFSVLLSHYSGQEEIVVGTDVANRNRAETEGLIGFFVNQLVMRTDLRGNPSFRELLQRVREMALGAYAHQDLPFEKLVEELRPERSLKYAPVFQVKLVLQNGPGVAGEFVGLRMEAEVVESGTAQMEMIVNLEERSGEVEGNVEYSTEVYEEERVERMMRGYERILERVIEGMEVSVSELQHILADLDEKHRLSKEKALEETSIQKLKQIRRQSASEKPLKAKSAR